MERGQNANCSLSRIEFIKFGIVFQRPVSSCALRPHIVHFVQLDDHNLFMLTKQLLNLSRMRNNVIVRYPIPMYSMR